MKATQISVQSKLWVLGLELRIFEDLFASEYESRIFDFGFQPINNLKFYMCQAPTSMA